MPELNEGQDNYKVKIYNPQNPNYPFQRKVRIDEIKKGKIEGDFGKYYTEWYGNTATLRSRVQRWIANSEGISQPKETPWQGACSLHKPLTETRMNIVHSFFMGVIRPRIGRLFRCTTDNKVDKEIRDLCRSVELYFNTNFEFNKMYVKNLSEAFWAVLRDGTIGRTLDWLKKIVRKWEVVTYKTLDEFLEKFPDPQSAGMSEKEFMKAIEELSNGRPVTLDEEYDDTICNYPVVDFSEIKDVVWFPVTAKSQDKTIFLGKNIWLTKSEVISLARVDKVFDESIIELLESPPRSEVDSVTLMQSSIEGIIQTEPKTFYKFTQGRYKADLDEDGIEEVYLVTYSLDFNKFVQFDRYPYYHGNDNIRITGFKKRPKRLLYRGLAESLEDLNEEANVSVRQKIDSMSITNSPMFKAVDTLKGVLDMSRPSNKFRPGGMWYIPPSLYDKVEQVKVDKKDFGDFAAHEANLNRDADNLFGASELRSGRETPSDPRAPAAKTAMLLNQSASRLDDFVYDFLLNENEILDDVLKLYYQYHPEKLEFYVEKIKKAEGSGNIVNPMFGGQMPQPGLPMSPIPMPEMNEETEYEKKELDTSKLKNKQIHLQLSFISMIENPEFLKAIWEEFYAKYGQEPMLGAIPETRHKILDEIISNMPEAVGKGLLQPLPKILASMPMLPQVNGAGGGNSPVNPTLQSAISSPTPKMM